MQSLTRFIKDINQLQEFCLQLAPFLQQSIVIYMRGDLGAGKTTLVRQLLKALGVTDKIKSPTFTLVESYTLKNNLNCYHFDLYRIASPLELEYIGIRDYFAEDALMLVEWPEKGADLLPQADINVDIDFHKIGRKLIFKATTKKGESILNALQGNIHALD